MTPAQLFNLQAEEVRLHSQTSSPQTGTVDDLMAFSQMARR